MADQFPFLNSWSPSSRHFCRELATAFSILLLLGGCQVQSPPSESEIHRQTSGSSSSAASDASARMTFRDVASGLGVDWTYRNGEEARIYSIVESMGGGLALCDFNQDGRLDLIAAGGGSFPGSREITGLPTGVFLQAHTGQFTDVSKLTGLNGQEFYNHGVSAGDFDHDGFPDLVLTGYGGIALYRNQGDGSFLRDCQEEESFRRGWSTSAGWGDFNHDGHPDLFVVHYADWSFDNDPPCPGPPPDGRDVCPPRRFHGLPDQLFLSDGRGGFREVAFEVGVRSERKGIGLAIADLDLDGDLDIYVTNDTDPNDLYRNDGQGHFEEVGLTSGAALGADGNADGSMGVAVGDLDGDGLPDLWVTNFQRESFAFYRNLGDGLFKHVSRLTGISSLPGSFVGWGTAMLDADSDGDEDLFVANGHVVHFPTQSTVRQRPLLLENRHGSRFFNVADTAGLYMRTPHSGRGVAFGDFDGDGDPDLVVSHVNEPVALLSNESPGAGRLTIRLIGRNSPRQPIGAVVRLTVGQRTSVQQVQFSTSYASTSSDVLFFGLGDQRAGRLEIDWPSGIRQVLETLPPGQSLTVIEPH